MRSPDKIWIEPAWAETFARPDGDPAKVAYIPEAISQAAVAAALEAAAVIAETHQVYQAHVCAARIRALITPAQHDALAAHGAAEVAKARAEQARDAALVEAAARFPDSRQPWPAHAIRKAILAIRDKPAPAVTVRESYVMEGRHPNRQEARDAAKVLMNCNGADINDWSDDIWPDDDYIDAIRAIAGGGDE